MLCDYEAIAESWWHSCGEHVRQQVKPSILASVVREFTGLFLFRPAPHSPLDAAIDCIVKVHCTALVGRGAAADIKTLPGPF